MACRYEVMKREAIGTPSLVHDIYPFVHEFQMRHGLHFGRSTRRDDMGELLQRAQKLKLKEELLVRTTKMRRVSSVHWRLEERLRMRVLVCSFYIRECAK